MRARLRLLFLALLPFLSVLLFTPPAVQAGAGAQVSIDVIHGTKAGSGPDERSKKHHAVLERMPNWKGYRFVETLTVDAPVGQLVEKATSGRKVQVTVQGLTADKATTKVEVIGPTGKKHGLTSSIKRGATMVVVEQSADGGEVYVYVVTVTY